MQRLDCTIHESRREGQGDGGEVEGERQKCSVCEIGVFLIVRGGGDRQMTMKIVMMMDERQVQMRRGHQVRADGMDPMSVGSK